MNAKAALGVLLALLPAAQASADERRALAHDDVHPSVVIFTSSDLSVRMGGLLQLHLAPWVGEDAQLDDQDPAAQSGFRLRRARLGVDATLPRGAGFLLVLSPLDSDPESSAISEARLTLPGPAGLRLWVGADKVPFSRAELMSSANLASIERPLVARTLVPQRRLGAVIEGAYLDNRLKFAAGVMNGTEGYERGNQFGGELLVARVEGEADAGPVKLGIGLGGFYENGPATRTMAASADLHASVAGASLLLEGICDRTKPEDSPVTSPEVPSTVKRCGGYAEATYLVEKLRTTGVVRVELLDDNLDVEDAGDAWLLSAGMNLRASANVRLQLHYLGRYERKGSERANDSVIMNLQGEL